MMASPLSVSSNWVVDAVPGGDELTTLSIFASASEKSSRVVLRPPSQSTERPILRVHNASSTSLNSMRLQILSNSKHCEVRYFATASSGSGEYVGTFKPSKKENEPTATATTSKDCPHRFCISFEKVSVGHAWHEVQLKFFSFVPKDTLVLDRCSCSVVEPPLSSSVQPVTSTGAMPSCPANMPSSIASLLHSMAGSTLSDLVSDTTSIASTVGPPDTAIEGTLSEAAATSASLPSAVCTTGVAPSSVPPLSSSPGAKPSTMPPMPLDIMLKIMGPSPDTGGDGGTQLQMACTMMKRVLDQSLLDLQEKLDTKFSSFESRLSLVECEIERMKQCNTSSQT
eukprot:TRINITY_DN6091_c0_g1_i1.p1 TRINITY_DN6091_c0_g1~~TRINITY_DN6091_c0_g1_i1.p1  ORF type:complete len:340 (-),score=41.67 TRINITY_DN6091_c0_g1_i1:585-1604(-)